MLDTAKRLTLQLDPLLKDYRSPRFRVGSAAASISRAMALHSQGKRKELTRDLVGADLRLQGELEGCFLSQMG